MAVTAAMVKELREMTGAGMMDCKKALTATEGDMDAAVEFLRKNGQAKAEKKAGRIAAEGICRIAVKDEGTAAVVEVNSETDFVAKNEKFQNFVAAVAEQAVNSDNTELEAFLDEAWHEEPSKTVKEVLVEQIAVIGENLKIRRFQKVTAPLVVSYTHGGGRIGVLVEADTDVKNDAVKEALTNVAMQIAALSPKYVSTADVSEEYKAHEKEILMAQIQNDPKMAGKPEKVIEGAVSGRLNKELKEVCLLEQVYVKAEDGKQTVAQYLAQVAKENNANLTVKGFVRFETGEGIEALYAVALRHLPGHFCGDDGFDDDGGRGQDSLFLSALQNILFEENARLVAVEQPIFPVFPAHGDSHAIRIGIGGQNKFRILFLCECQSQRERGLFLGIGIGTGGEAAVGRFLLGHDGQRFDADLCEDFPHGLVSRTVTAATATVGKIVMIRDFPMR